MSTPDFRAPSKPKMSNKRKYTLFAIGGGIGLVGYLWYRKRATSSGTSTDQGGTSSDSTIDPATGIPYADESQGQYGTPGILGSYNPVTGTYNPGTGTGGITTTATNAEWAQASEAYLVSNGYDPATVAAALGLYLAGLPLTQDQYDIVSAALAFEGQPPNGAPNPVMAGGGGTGQGGGSGGPPLHHPPVVGAGGVKVPSVVGSRGYVARLAITAKGLKADQTPKPSAVPKNKATHVTSQSPAGGTKVKLGSTVHINVRVGK